jgi:hypothetical protein
VGTLGGCRPSPDHAGALEVEELGVGVDPRGRRRPREHRAAALQGVAQRDLGGAAAGRLGDALHGRVGEQAWV